MSRERVNALFQAHAEAIERHRRYIASHENIMLVLADLAAGAITEGQALSILEQAAEQIEEPGRAALYRQTIASVRQMQTDGALLLTWAAEQAAALLALEEPGLSPRE